MERLVIKKKRDPNSTGITVVYDEDGVGHELAIADYPIDTPLIKTESGWEFDEKNSPFSDAMNKSIRNREEYYFLTQDVLPYRTYLHMISTYPESCVKMWKRNPYEVLEIDETIPFSLLDRKMVLSRFEHRLYEMKYAISEILKRNEKAGHTYMSYDEFCIRLMNLLRKNGHALSSKDEIKAYLNFYKDQFYVKDNVIAFLRTYKMEKFIYDYVMFASKQSRFSSYVHRQDEDLSNEQNNAVEESIAGGNISILSGGPGTGKTTTTRTIVTSIKDAYPDASIVLLAPTGQASRRIKEVFGDLPVSTSTIHYFLGYGHQRNRQESERIKDADFIIIDEGSMVGVELFYSLISQISEGTKILIVGDADQLPSVEPGNVLNDLISLGVNTAWLTENFRSGDAIVKNAKTINEGNCELEENANFKIVEVPNDKLLQYATDISVKNRADILLTPYRKEETTSGMVIFGSCTAINRAIHDIKYPGERYFAIGEPVVINHTDYRMGYVNGDTGTVVRKDLEAIYVMLNDGRTLSVKNLEDIDLCHAQTIHKTQGSEYPEVAICIPEGCASFFSRQMLYTGVTRAKKGVIIFGSSGELPAIIANNTKVNKRTFLSLFAEERKKEKVIPYTIIEQEEYER